MTSTSMHTDRERISLEMRQAEAGRAARDFEALEKQLEDDMLGEERQRTDSTVVSLENRLTFTVVRYALHHVFTCGEADRS